MTNLDVGLFLGFQAVRNLVAAVLKQKGPNEQITQSSPQVSYFSKLSLLWYLNGFIKCNRFPSSRQKE